MSISGKKEIIDKIFSRIQLAIHIHHLLDCLFSSKYARICLIYLLVLSVCVKTYVHTNHIITKHQYRKSIDFETDP
jgi:hypothetical protein